MNAFFGVDMKPTILIVDSASENLMSMNDLLREHYTVRMAASGEGAFQKMDELPRPALVLLDESLPDMDGYAVLQEMRASFMTVDIPVLMLSSSAETFGGRRALEAGAADVLRKPVLPELLRARVATHIELTRLRNAGKDEPARLNRLVAERTREAVEVRDAAIMAIACLAEAGDTDTARHVRRTQRYFTALAREMRFHGNYRAELGDIDIALMAQAVPLHDIGKLRVPDAILNKPGRLTVDEFEIMKQHTVFGRDAIACVAQAIGGDSRFLRYAQEIAGSHQEKWNGSGYPEGLAGASIPLSARLMAVADVYDALISSRVYKPTFTHETAIELIRQGSGEHFDPAIVDALLAVEHEFRTIAGGELEKVEAADALPFGERRQLVR
jgi:putative two-component system response regulator